MRSRFLAEKAETRFFPEVELSSIFVDVAHIINVADAVRDNELEKNAEWRNDTRIRLFMEDFLPDLKKLYTHYVLLSSITLSLDEYLTMADAQQDVHKNKSEIISQIIEDGFFQWLDQIDEKESE